MRRKLLKGFLIFSILLFSLGMFSVFGLNSFKSDVVQETNVESSSSGNVDLLLNENSNSEVLESGIESRLDLTTVSENASGSLQQRFATKYTVKLINNANDLAELAYKVNSGDTDENKVDTIYFLTSDIDLSDGDSIHYWTPIGTSSKSFQGIFYGNGKTISNIHINELSTAGNGYGLFGVNTGVISNLKVENVNTPSSNSTDTIVATNNGFVVDCDGSVASGTAKMSSITLNINANDGYFKRGNNYWYESDKIKFTTSQNLSDQFDYYQVYSDSSNNGFSGFKNTTNSFYTKLTRRENASADDVYLVRQGYYAADELVYVNASTSYRVNWGSQKKYISVTFDHGYGTRRNVVTSFEYDQTFSSWFAANAKYKTRAGYSFSSLKVNENGATYDTDGDIYNQSYPKYTRNGDEITSTAYFTWTWDNDKATTVNVTTQVAKTDGFTISSAGAIVGEHTYIETTGSNTTSSTKQFTITLNDGYEILLNTYKNDPGQTGCNGQSANNGSGVYVNFTNWTGEDPNYNANKDNDSYNPVYATITQNGNKYTITLHNLVGGSAGFVWISIQRVDIKVKLTPELTTDSGLNPVYSKNGNDIKVTYGDNNTYQMTWSLGNNPGYNRLELVEGDDGNNVAYLITKMEEEASLTFSGDTTYILSIRGTYGIDINKHYVAVTGDEVNEYLNTKTLTIKAINGSTVSTNISEIIYYIGPIRTKVNVEFYNINDPNTKVYLSGGNYAGINISINGSGGLENADSLVRFSQKTDDTFKVKANGYYRAHSIKVYNGQTNTIADNGEIDSLTLDDDGFSKASKNIFKNAFVDQGINYTVKVYLTERTYNVNVEYYYKEDDYKDEVGISSLFGTMSVTRGGSSITNLENLQTQLPSANNADSLSFTVSYNNTGKQILKYKNYVISQEGRGETLPAGHADCAMSSSDNFNVGTWNFLLKLGTYDTTIKLYFDYKIITVNVDADTSDNVSKWLETSGAYQFTYIDNNVGLKAVNDGIVSVDVRSDLYLKGWTIGGSDYTNSGFSILNYSGVLNHFKDLGDNDNNVNGDFSVSVTPIIDNRTLTIRYSSGSHNSEIYPASGNYSSTTNFVTLSHTDCTDNITSSSSAFTLATNNSQFQRIGYTQNGWIDFVGGVQTINGGASYQITNVPSNWYNIFEGTSGNGQNYETWNSIKASDNKVVDFVANWTAINYTVIVDGSITHSIILGTSITCIPQNANQERDGSVNYDFSNKTDGYINTKLPGHIANSFNISHNGSFNNISNFAFNAENAKTLLDPANYFATNATDIVISTNRTVAQYTVTAKGSPYYKVNGGNVDFSLENATYGQSYTINTTQFTRTGYTCVGFRRLLVNEAEDLGGSLSGNTYTIDEYNITADIIIVPVWKRTGVTTTSTISDLTSNITTFYTFTSHDVYQGGIKENAVENQTSVEIGDVLFNGEKVKKLGFKLVRTGSENYVEKANSIFNIEDFTRNNNVVVGEYTIYFYIEVDGDNTDDLLYTVDELNYDSSYKAISSGFVVTLVKNELLFTGDYHSIYNGTSEFVPSEANDFGQFYCRYDWDGTEIIPENLPEEKEYLLIDINGLGEDKYFNKFVIQQKNGGYNSGSGYDMRAYITKSQFTILSQNYGTNYDGIFANVTVEPGNNYYATVEGRPITNNVKTKVTTIDKAQINLTSVGGGVISIPSGSSYYFEGVETIVYANTNNNVFTFNVGKQTFKFTYEKIALVSSEAGTTYQGANNYLADSEVFKVYGLIVKINDVGHDFEDVDENFEWAMPTSFTFSVLDSSSAIKLIYKTKYLTASNGQLNANLLDTFANNSETLQIVPIVNNVAINIDASRGETQYSHSVNNQILFSFVGNKTSEIVVYVNNETLSSTGLKFNVSVIEPRSELRVLAWGDQTISSAYDEEFTEFNAPTTKQFEEMTSQTQYAVLTDVVKLLIDHNDGDGDNYDNTIDTVYVSSSSNVTISNPVHSYSGLIFAGYTSLGLDTNLQSTIGVGNYQFISNHGGKTETIYAKWQLNNIVASLIDYQNNNNPLNVKASQWGNILAIDDIVNMTPFSWGQTTYTLSGGGINGFDKTEEGDAFKIQNANGFTPVSMKGTYTLTITLNYTDNKQAPQQISSSFEFYYNITINTVGIERDEQNTLVFNNQNQIANVDIKTRLNGVESTTTLDQVDVEHYGYSVSILSDTKHLTEINLVDRYSLTVTIDPQFSEVYQLEAGYNVAYVSVEKFVILLEDYVEQINLFKYYRDNEPPLRSDILIVENNNDVVNITFTRESGDYFGFYQLSYLSITNGADADNYEVDDTDFEAYFEVKVPEKRILIRMHDILTYIYDGSALSGLTIVKVGDDYLLRGTTNSGYVSTNIDLYYVSVEGGVVSLDLSGLVNFNLSNTKNVGEYHIGVSLNNSAPNVEDWEGVEIINQENAKILVTKKDITIEAITKTFDRNNLITNDTYVQFDNKVAGDNLTASGEFSSVTVGINLAFENLALAGNDAQNYNLTNADFDEGIINPRAINQIQVQLGQNTIQYGNISRTTSVGDLFSYTDSLISIDGITSDLSNGFITLTNWSVDGDPFSTTDYLQAGQKQIKIFFTSTNFTGISDQGYTVNLNIAKLELDLSWVDVVKNYDGTTALPKVIVLSISNMIIDGDDVDVDKEASGYQTSNIGQRIAVNFVLKGADKDNYRVKDNVYGKINKFAVTFRVNATTENEDLVTYGSFVNDSQTVVVVRQLLTVDFPNDLTAQAILSSFVFPTRIGYTAVGWKYIDDGNNYVLIDETNIQALVSSVALDEENVNSIINIYTVWEINNYGVNVGGEHLSSFEVTGSKVVGNAYDGYFAEYYSDIQIDVVGENGYKTSAYTVQQGACQSIDTSDTGKNSGAVEITKVLKEINLETLFTDIQVTLNYNLNLPAFAEEKDRTETNPLKAVYSYSALKTLDKNGLPKFALTAGTYNLSDFVYGNLDTSIGNKKINEIVDELVSPLETDCEIELKLIWVGQSYLATFNSQGGILTGDEQLNIVYGEALIGLPTASKPGKTAVWTCEDSRQYWEGDIFRSIGVKNGNNWEIIFNAVYTNNTYSLIVNLGTHISARVNGVAVIDGQSFNIVYEEGSLEIIVSTDQGYEFLLDQSQLNGEISVSENSVTISNLIENGELTINSTPANNILTLINRNFKSMVVKVNDEIVNPVEITGAYQISALTGTTVLISLESAKGTAFNENSVIYSGDSAAHIEKTLSAFNKQIDITWSNFTSNATIRVDVELADNVVSFGDISNVFDSISINGVGLSTSGDNILIKTNQVANVRATLKYGYKDAVMMASNDIVQVSNPTNAFGDIDRKFHYSASLEFIDEDIVLTFTSEKREFTFVIQVNAEQSELGEITSTTTQTVEFGDDIILSQNVLNDRYVFLNWTMGGEAISNQENDTITIDTNLSTLMERTPYGENILVIANYKEKIATITFIAGNKGRFTVVQGEESFDVLANQSITKTVLIGGYISFVLSSDNGYEFDQLLVDDVVQEANEYEIEGQTITYYLTSDTTIESFKITFKASDAYIYVDAALMLNFELNRYTTQGGKVFISDENGTKASDQAYLAVDGELEIGGKYKMLSKTDATIYFVAEARTGFEVTFSNPTKDCVLNEYTVSDKLIYSFVGVKDGTIIEAIFAAKQNKVHIVLVEQSLETVPAGQITVDTTSALVRASANNSANVMASIVTGETLNVEVKTGFTYRFDVDENNALKYTLSKEESEGTVVLVGQVLNLNPLSTGCTNSVTLQIENVDADATIYIFVKAEKYNLAFYIDDNNSVVLNDVLQYGKEFSLSGLTLAQKERIMVQRDGFTLDGYYTKQLGQGNKYVDGQANPYSVWFESGYVYNGTQYEYASNYDVSTKTFTLYPYWIYNKANIWVDTIPEDILRQNGNISIRSVIVNYDDSTSWISQNDLWFTQIRVGNQLQIRAYELQGYVFKYWLIMVDGGEPVQRDSEFSIILEQADYELVAVYQPRYNITIEDIDGRNSDVGSAYLLQDNVVLTGGSYDSSKTIEIEALPTEGYQLLYFQDIDSEEIYIGEFDENTNKTKYTFTSLIDRPLNLKAVFEGKVVLIEIDYESIESYHQITKVTVNGTEVNYRNVINAKVGDTLEIQISKRFGYTFSAQGATFTVTSEQNMYTFNIILAVKDLQPTQNNKYKMDITFSIEKEDIIFSIAGKVKDSTGIGEDVIASKIEIVYSNGRKIVLNEGGSFTVYYGDVVNLYISPNRNYKLEQIYIRGDFVYSIFNYYDGEKIEIDSDFINANIDENLGHQIIIEVTFNRLVWIMEEYRSSSLAGEGSEENPYLIRNEEDMAYVAYVINNGEENEEGVKYADCHYKLTNDLDFEGKYFESIGTKENPFNGVLDLGDYNIKNVTHYKVYSDPKTQANGLVWCVTKDAKIIQQNRVLIITLSVFGGAIVITGAVLLWVFLSRRRKRKMNATL